MKTHAALQAPMAACGTLVLLEVGQAQTLLTQFFQETGRLPYSLRMVKKVLLATHFPCKIQ